ncbi:ABC transporter permease [Streptomyces sp. NPDC048636]|uniref:ABC transporter permease n=1 Tax=Streptomyces sp. NPDC048636 TaxID=3155762 RepID=UPI003439FFBC
MRVFTAAFRFQLALARRKPDTVHVLVTAPLFTLVFVSIGVHAHRPDFTASAVLAPVLMSLWSLALLTAGDLISQERSRGTLEAIVATPARFATVVLGRLTAVASVALVCFAESWLMAWACFGVVLTIAHPLVFALCLVCSSLAMAGTASLLSAVFVLMPSARVLQNTLTYPFYLLGGLLVPVADLPGWLHPLSRVVFLSWSSDLLRASVSGPAGHWWMDLAAIVGLGMAGAVSGALLIGAILRRVRRTGTLALT